MALSSTTGRKSARKPSSSIGATLSPTSVVVSRSSNSRSIRCGEPNIVSRNRDGDNNAHVGSSTSVRTAWSSSFASLLPTAAATAVPANSASNTTVMPKPFFVMDWLEEGNPKDVELARQIINSPNNLKKGPLQRSIIKGARALRREPPASPLSSSITQTRSAINLSSLSHEEDESSCRQLDPVVAPATTGDDIGRNELGSESPGDTGTSTLSLTTLSRATSETSLSTSVTSMSVTTPPYATLGTARMSPFKKRSIAIGKGWNAKGLLKAKKGSWESALSCWENALEIRTQVLGETHPDVANTCNNIGIALGKLGRYDEAIEILERALKLRAKHHGTREHVEVAATLHNIGNVLHAAQDCSGAIQCFWDAKLMQEHLLGPNHVEVARACVAIANVYYEAQQYDDAKEAYKDALQVFAKAGLYDQHPEVLAVLQDLKDIESISLTKVQQQQQQYPPFPGASRYHQPQQPMYPHHHKTPQQHPTHMF